MFTAVSWRATERLYRNQHYRQHVSDCLNPSAHPYHLLSPYVDNTIIHDYPGINQMNFRIFPGKYEAISPWSGRFWRRFAVQRWLGVVETVLPPRRFLECGGNYCISGFRFGAATLPRARRVPSVNGFG